MKFGQKAIHLGKFGSKRFAHEASKFGQKAVQPAVLAASVAAPELALPAEIGAMVARPLLKSLQRSTK